MERRNFSKEFETLQNECAQAIVNLFNQYGITELVLMEDIDIEEYTWGEAVKLGNVASSWVNEWFLLHMEGDDCWFPPGARYYNGAMFNFALLYDRITDTIDCLIAKNVPVQDWGNLDVVRQDC